MATEPAHTEPKESVPYTGPATIERNNGRTRWFHAAVYLLVLVLLLTGWWLTLGQEGRPSVLARLIGRSDADIHTVVGWTFAGIAVLGVLIGRRGARTLLTDSVRFRRTDLRWFARWPKALFTGRFGRHDGHFDPGQRIANIVMIALLLALIASGVGLVLVSGGPAFVWFNRVHRWSTYLFTAVAAGHILIAVGILPGYRGVWRAMHLGGRLRRSDAARVWPGWTERAVSTGDGEPAATGDGDGEPAATGNRPAKADEPPTRTIRGGQGRRPYGGEPPGGRSRHPGRR